MARRKKAEAEEQVEGIEAEAPQAKPPRNAEARAAIIRDVCETIGEYDRQIDGIKAERKAVIETRIVADLGMKKGDFNAAYKLSLLDQDDRDGLFDTIREVFSASAIGTQINWLDAADTA